MGMNKIQMTHEEHRLRHQRLHQAFDELMADFLSQHDGKHLSNTTLLELMEWSYQQTLNPTEPK